MSNVLPMKRPQRETPESVMREVSEYKGSLTLLRNTHVSINEEFNIDNSLVELYKFLEKTEVDPYGIYCQQTGQRIGELEHQQVKLAIMLNKNLECFAQCYHMANVIEPTAVLKTSHHWLVTNPERLDVLKEIDPYGFYMFCVNKLTRAGNPEFNSIKRKWSGTFHRKQHNDRLIRGWQILQNAPLDDILLANDRLAKLFAHHKASKKFQLSHNPLDYVTPSFIKRFPIIINSLMVALVKEIKTKHDTPRSAKATLKSKHKDSAFAGMAINKDRTKENFTKTKLDELFQKHGLSTKTNSQTRYNMKRNVERAAEQVKKHTREQDKRDRQLANQVTAQEVSGDQLKNTINSLPLPGNPF